MAETPSFAASSTLSRNGKKASEARAEPFTGKSGNFTSLKESIRSFKEKPQGKGSMINSGFFVLQPSVLELIQDDSTVWEREPLEQLAQQGQLAAFHHEGFWQPMDTLREKSQLEALWASGHAPWKVW